MKKTSKTSKKGKRAPRRGEAPVSRDGHAFAPMQLRGLADSRKQYNAEGFKK